MIFYFSYSDKKFTFQVDSDSKYATPILYLDGNMKLKVDNKIIDPVKVEDNKDVDEKK